MQWHGIQPICPVCMFCFCIACQHPPSIIWHQLLESEYASTTALPSGRPTAGAWGLSKSPLLTMSTRLKATVQRQAMQALQVAWCHQHQWVRSIKCEYESQCWIVLIYTFESSGISPLGLATAFDVYIYIYTILYVQSTVYTVTTFQNYNIYKCIVST